MKVLIIAPHCSTGGMPAYVEAYMAAASEAHDIHFAEYHNYSDEYTVQRDRIRARYPWSCHHGEFDSFWDRLRGGGWDVVHFQEEPGSFMPREGLEKVLAARGDWLMALTSHERDLDYGALPYIADAYIAICPWQAKQITEGVPSASVHVWEYPVTPAGEVNKPEARMAIGGAFADPTKKHLVQVGLWTAHKRQDWTMAAASYLSPEWHVHFVGNRAPNMRDYWEGLQPGENYTVWGERADVADFLKAADAFILPSSKELAPISLREALSAGLPCYVSPLEVYEGAHSDQPVHFLDMDRHESLAEFIND